MTTYDSVPEHMREGAEDYDHWAPQFYEESECEHCGRPIYRYQMDLIVQWKHLDHSAYCVTTKAKPREEPHD